MPAKSRQETLLSQTRRTTGRSFNDVTSGGNGGTEIQINNAFFKQLFKRLFDSVAVMGLPTFNSILFYVEHPFATARLMKLTRGNCSKCIGQIGHV